MYCRICAKAYAILLDIAKEPNLVTKISKTLHITVSYFEIVSTHICNPCLEIINTLWEFYEHIEQTQKVPSSKALRSEAHCSLCYCPYNILKGLTNARNLCFKIQKLYPSTVKEGDFLPKYICEPCIDGVSYHWEFYIDSQKNQITLHRGSNDEMLENIMEDIFEDNNSRCSSETLSDELLQELSVEYIEEEIKQNSSTIKKVDTPVVKELIIIESEPPNIEKRQSGNREEKLDKIEEEPNDSITKDRSKVCTRRGSLATVGNVGRQVPEKMDSSATFGNEPDRRGGNFYCICCRKVWNTEATRLTHERNMFRPTMARQCKDCNKIFRSKLSHKRHITLYGHFHSFRCDLCRKKFVDSNDFALHKRAHEIKFSRSCRLCKQDCNTFGSLAQHEMNHRRRLLGKPLPYECIICGAEYEARDEAMAHLSLHKFSERAVWPTFETLLMHSVMHHS